MKVPFTLGVVGHFGLAVGDPKMRGLGLEKLFEFDDGVAIGNDHDRVAEGSKNMGLWFQDLDGYRWELSVQGGK